MSTLKNKKLASLVVVALLALAGLGALARLSSPGRGPAMKARAESVKRPDEAVSLARAEATEIGQQRREGLGVLARGLRPGDRLEYQFSQRRSVLFQALELPSDAGTRESPTAELEMTSRGLFSVRVYAEHERGLDVGFKAVRVGVEFSSPELRGTTGGVEQLEEEVMSGEVLASLSRGGRVDRLAFPAEMDPEARNYWRDTLARWQVVFPEVEPTGDEWTIEETDATGTYLARYRRVAQGEPHRLAKTKLSYRSIHGGSGESDLALPAGEVAIVYDACLLSLVAHEELVLETPGFAKRIDTRVDYTFERTAFEHEPRHPRPELAVLEQATVSSLSDMEGGLGAAEGDVPAELTIAQLLSELEASLDAEGRRSKAVTTRMRQLIQLLREDPEAVAATLARLAAQPCSNDLSAVLIGAFGGAGSLAAQHALQKILLEPSWGEERQNMALLSFAQVTNPGPAIDAALLELHQGGGRLALPALYLLGTVGRQLAGTDATRFLAIQDTLRFNAQPGQSLDARISALQAMSNMGLAQVVPEVELALDHPNEELRRASLQALTRCFDERAGQLLEAAASKDPAVNVRLAAVEALSSKQRPYAAELLQRVARQDSSDDVRMAALRALASSFGRLASTRQVLLEVARTDRSSDIAAFAQELVAASH